MVFGTNSGRVYALHADGGELAWARRQKGEIASTPAIDGGSVFVSSMDGTLTAYGAGAGVPLWSFSTDGSPIESSPLVVDGLVYVGTWAGGLHAVDAATGEQRWRYQAPRRHQGQRGAGERADRGRRLLRQRPRPRPGDGRRALDVHGRDPLLRRPRGARRHDRDRRRRRGGHRARRPRRAPSGGATRPAAPSSTPRPRSPTARAYVGSYNGPSRRSSSPTGRCDGPSTPASASPGSATVVDGVVYTAAPLRARSAPRRTYGLDTRTGAVRFEGRGRPLLARRGRRADAVPDRDAPRLCPPRAHAVSASGSAWPGWPPSSSSPRACSGSGCGGGGSTRAASRARPRASSRPRRPGARPRRALARVRLRRPAHPREPGAPAAPPVPAGLVARRRLAAGVPARPRRRAGHRGNQRRPRDGARPRRWSAPVDRPAARARGVVAGPGGRPRPLHHHPRRRDRPAGRHRRGGLAPARRVGRRVVAAGGRGRGLHRDARGPRHEARRPHRGRALERRGPRRREGEPRALGPERRRRRLLRAGDGLPTLGRPGGLAAREPRAAASRRPGASTPARRSPTGASTSATSTGG